MNILDSRDLAKRLEELQDERNAIVETIEDAEEKYNDILDTESCDLRDNEQDEAKDDLASAKLALTDWDIDNKEELDELETIESEVSEWTYGATLIDKSDFVDYCRELLEDIGDIPRDMPSYIVIDWEATEDNLKADYITVTYQGTDYLVRE